MALLGILAAVTVPFAGTAASDMTAPDNADAAPFLQIGPTRYRGARTVDEDVEVFRGVPFAAPPVGALRWRPPAPPEPFDGERPATAFAPVCLQGSYLSDWYRRVVRGFGGDPAIVDDPPESEDCLYLNVWRPAIRNDSPLPVIVFIHGGGNTGGWSWEPNYDGARLAREGFVVVTLTYRLGVFGFFSHPDQDIANFGLLDQVAALSWIRDHAAAIGADPGRITVAGESSGGNNIVYLLTSSLARGLFQRAVVQSAGWALQETTKKSELDELGLALARLVTGDEALDALRVAPAQRVFDAARDLYAEPGYDPVIDGHSVLEPAIDTVREGGLAPVDLLIGSNEDEWKMYLPETATLADWTTQGLPETARAAATRLLAEEADGRRALDRAVTARLMVCPSLHLAAAVAAAGGESWVYWFTRQRPGAVATTMGAYHGAELPYVFDTHDDWLPTDARDRALTRTIVTYWTRFARTGDPNGPQVARWPAFAGSGGGVLQLDVAPRILPRHPEATLCGVLGVEGQRSDPR